jgi:predicted small lipoprotein YifL
VSDYPRRHVVGAVALVSLAAASLAGCGSKGTLATPQGLTGTPVAAAVPAVANQPVVAAAATTAAPNAAPDSANLSPEELARTTLTPQPGSFLAGKTTVSYLGTTTPANGDENPYAIWPVTQTIGSVSVGDVLVTNFNNKSNKQGTGATIVDVHPDRTTTVFADLTDTKTSCPGGIGLTTAMVQLKTGWVIVGSLPSSDGTTETANQGCLLVLSPTGKPVEMLSGPNVVGPWDAVVSDEGDTATLFITNTLVGLDHASTATASAGNVVRLSLAQTADSPPKVTDEAIVVDGLPEQGDPSAFVKGPTGLALGKDGTLYVANTVGNNILAVPQALTRTSSAGTGTVLSSGGQLANPLGLVMAPNGNLLAANASNGKIVEITTAGKQVGEYYAIENVGQDPPGNGDLFGIAIDAAGTGILFVKDDENSLGLLHS